MSARVRAVFVLSAALLVSSTACVRGRNDGGRDGAGKSSDGAGGVPQPGPQPGQNTDTSMIAPATSAAPAASGAAAAPITAPATSPATSPAPATTRRP